VQASIIEGPDRLTSLLGPDLNEADFSTSQRRRAKTVLPWQQTSFEETNHQKEKEKSSRS
jgi:hypothetical protein